MKHILNELETLGVSQSMFGKGFLGVALVVTDQALTDGLPLNSQSMLVAGGAQIKGASGPRVKKILRRHGINRQLTAEGGRTSRGGPAKMRAYVEFLNLHAGSPNLDLRQIEEFWLDKVRAFFAARPFRISLDPAQSISAAIRALVAAIEERQREMSGATIVGTVIQHLIGAKLETVLGLEDGQIARHGANVSDQSGRGGDLELGDTVIHVTTAPGAQLIEKCSENLKGSKRPIVVTSRRRLTGAEGLVEDAGLKDRVDIFDYEGFLTSNIFELGKFRSDGRREALERIIVRYNLIVDRMEGDPSLRIEIT